MFPAVLYACCSMIRCTCPALLNVLNLHLATALRANTGQLLMSSFCLYRMNAKLKEIELNDDDSVKRFRMADGSTLEGDLYVSAMPGTIHICSTQPVTVNCVYVSSQSGVDVWFCSVGNALLHLVHMLHSRSLAVPAHARRVCHYTSPTDMMGQCLPLLPQGLKHQQTRLAFTTPMSKSSEEMSRKWRHVRQQIEIGSGEIDWLCLTNMLLAVHS
jgi:hypothetical protein